MYLITRRKGTKVQLLLSNRTAQEHPDTFEPETVPNPKISLPLPLLPRSYWGLGMYKDALGPELFVFVCFFHSLRLSLSRLHTSVKRILP